jgi:hypothetical protein
MLGRRRALSRRALLLIGSALVLLNAGTLAVALHFARSSNDDATTTRADPIADLLAWLPETTETRRAFSVWTGTSDPARLSLAPASLTLGHSDAWRTRYGYGAENVTAWATASPDSSLSVMKGGFDWAGIERALTAAGFTKSTYHRAVIFTATTAGPSDHFVSDGDSSGAAKVVAMLDQRLVAGASTALVRSAIDAAEGRTGSLADVPTIAGALLSLQPLDGLMSISQADQAIECGVGQGWTSAAVTPDALRFVIVAYGHLGVGGPPRTLVAMTFANENRAEGAFPAYEAGWREGFANAGGAGGAIASFGTVSNVSRNHAMLIAEIVNGTENGWARAGVRFAVAVCSPAAAALPAGTPPPAASPS